MQKINELNNDFIVKDLSNIAAQTAKDLEETKRDIREKELELKEMADLFNQKIKQATKTNQELQNKTQMLMEFLNTLEEQREELEQKNKELQIKENTYNNLNRELRTELAKITEKEKELELQKQYLEKQVKDKTNELVRSEKMATIGELTARLAHDLRNPLTVLKSTHAMMKEKPNMKVEDRLHYNSRIDRAILKIVHLVDDVLGFVRISDLDLQKISLISVLDSAIDSIDIPKDVKIIKPKTDTEVNCDIRKSEAVFANLLTNSIQAMNEDGKIEIRFNVKDDLVKIEIEDTGSGMTDSVIDRIFEPLFTTKPHGTGLGLSICKTIIEQHGGKISVKSNPTTFAIILPKNL